MTLPGRGVWITRAEPGASATAARLRAVGLDPLIAPLLSLRLLETSLDLGGVGALAFTSANGVRAFAARSDRRDLPVFTVGDATAQAARAAGFETVTSADGAASDLVRLIAAAQPRGVALHPSGLHLAGDVKGGLERAGIMARDVALYDTPAVDALPSGALEALAARGVAAVLIHSPRAADILAGLAAGLDLSRTLAVGLSAACLRPLEALGFAERIQAQRPREDALLDALRAALRR